MCMCTAARSATWPMPSPASGWPRTSNGAGCAENADNAERVAEPSRSRPSPRRTTASRRGIATSGRRLRCTGICRTRAHARPCCRPESPSTGISDPRPAGGVTLQHLQEFLRLGIPPTATPTSTATATSTSTPVPATATLTSTSTPVPPTATRTPTSTAVPPTVTATATSTTVPATATRTSTSTPATLLDGDPDEYAVATDGDAEMSTGTPVPLTATKGIDTHAGCDGDGTLRCRRLRRRHRRRPRGRRRTRHACADVSGDGVADLARRGDGRTALGQEGLRRSL